MKKQLQATVLWITVVPFIFLIDILLYVLGIFFKDFRALYIEKEILQIIDRNLH